jgi:hypothetical protein
MVEYVAIVIRGGPGVRCPYPLGGYGHGRTPRDGPNSDTYGHPPDISDTVQYQWHEQIGHPKSGGERYGSMFAVRTTNWRRP